MSKILYRGLQWFLALFAAYILFFSGSDRYFLGPVSLLFLLIPRMVERLFRMELGYPLKTMVLAFCFLGFHLGTALRWFDRGWGYDNMVHLFSGISSFNASNLGLIISTLPSIFLFASAAISVVFSVLKSRGSCQNDHSFRISFAGIFLRLSIDKRISVTPSFRKKSLSKHLLKSASLLFRSAIA